MTDISIHPLVREFYELMLEIEGFPASDHQTHVITKASALMDKLETHFQAFVRMTGAN